MTKHPSCIKSSGDERKLNGYACADGVVAYVIPLRGKFILTGAKVYALHILNVALTVPARVRRGMRLDKLGRRLL